MWMDLEPEHVREEYLKYRLPGKALCFGGALVRADGNVNLDQLWQLPEAFDMLAPGHYPADLEVRSASTWICPEHEVAQYQAQMLPTRSYVKYCQHACQVWADPGLSAEGLPCVLTV